MRKITIDNVGARLEWETLETFARVRVQEFFRPMRFSGT